MDVSDAKLLQDIRPSELGERLRAARLARGWTQTELAGDLVSVGYVSRLESGQRRPNAEVLESLAQRLDLPVDHLLRGTTAREQDEIRLALDFAELSLENGDHVEAEVGARSARDRARAVSRPDLVDRAQYLVARALEAQGSVDDAILELEPLVGPVSAIPCGKPGNVGPRDTSGEAAGRGIAIPRVRAAIALSRCYRISGDLNLAVTRGESVLADLAGTPLESADESVQLAVTVAAAYYERGDTGQAVRTCRKAIARAEQLGPPKARASAYWNASIMESERGSVAEAIPLAERALALLAEGSDGRNLARLRIGARGHAAPARPAGGRRGPAPAGAGRHRAARLQRRRRRTWLATTSVSPGSSSSRATSRVRSSSAPACTRPCSSSRPSRQRTPRPSRGRRLRPTDAARRPDRPTVRRSCC